VKRILLAAALVAAAIAAPATARPTAPDTGQWSVSTTGQTTALGYVDATCHFVPERWVHDYGPTEVRAIVATSGALSTTVRCELIWDGDYRGDETWTENAPVVAATGRFGFVPDHDVQVCVTASAHFATTDVAAPRVCQYV
jgi:hypothetical protein